MARSTSPDFAAGMGMALAELHRLRGSGTGDSSGVCEVAKAAGLTLTELEAAGLEEYDLEELRLAGLPEGEPRPKPTRERGERMTWALYRKIKERDLVGRRVRLRSKVVTKGGDVAAAGTICTITGKRNGVDVEVPACTVCGLGFRVHKLDPSALELLAPEPKA